MSLEEVLKAASEASDRGVPVNWRELCMHTYNVMMGEVHKLQREKEDGERARDLSGNTD